MGDVVHLGAFSDRQQAAPAWGVVRALLFCGRRPRVGMGHLEATMFIDWRSGLSRPAVGHCVVLVRYLGACASMQCRPRPRLCGLSHRRRHAASSSSYTHLMRSRPACVKEPLALVNAGAKPRRLGSAGSSCAAEDLPAIPFLELSRAKLEASLRRCVQHPERVCK